MGFSILDFELWNAPSLGGSLELEVDAWDAVGLLAAVLGCGAAAGLRPERIVLETWDECAFHQLTLKRDGWLRPSTAQARALEKGLEALLRRP